MDSLPFKRSRAAFSSFRTSLRVLGIVLTMVTASATANAQIVVESEAWSATRSDLTSSLALQERYSVSSAYGPRTRARAEARAASLRDRLERGDFVAGDRFTLRISGAMTLDETVSVLDGPRVVIVGVGPIELRGVLRSELESHLSQRITQSVLNASVRARPLVRMGVFGTVTTPGYQSVPLEERLDELLMRAGGPATEADPAGFAVMRGGEQLMNGMQVLAAIARGETIGSLRLAEGDYLQVNPRQPTWDRAATLQIATLVSGPLLTFFLLR